MQSYGLYRRADTFTQEQHDGLLTQHILKPRASHSTNNTNCKTDVKYKPTQSVNENHVNNTCQKKLVLSDFKEGEEVEPELLRQVDPSRLNY